MRPENGIIPRLTKIKIDAADSAPPFEGPELAQTISETHANVVYIDEDQELVDYLVDNVATGDVIVFLGSHGFRGMIAKSKYRHGSRSSRSAKPGLSVEPAATSPAMNVPCS